MEHGATTHTQNAKKLPPSGILSHHIAFLCSPCLGREQLERLCLIQKPTTCDALSGLPVQSMCMGMDRVMGQVGVKETLHMILVFSLLPPFAFASPRMFRIFLLLY